MVEWAIFLPYLIALILAAIPAPHLHEGSHWFVGWLGNTQPKPHWVFGIIPNGITHGAIETMDAELIRLSRLAPFIWLLIWILATIYFVVDRTPESLFAMMLPFYTVFFYSTESDCIAVRDPERYREMEINDEFQRNPIFLPNRVFPDLMPRV